MERSPETMDQWTQKERTKYCPFNFCLDSCVLKGEKCVIEKQLQQDHKPKVNIFDANKVRW